MARAAAWAIVCALAGLAAATPSAAARMPRGCHRTWPVSAFLAGEGAASPAHIAHRPIACGLATGYPTSETTLAFTNRGTVLFSPAGSENTLARSADGGRRWSLVGPARIQYTNLWNTVDPQVVVDRRTGRVFWVHTTFAVDLPWPLPDQSAAAWLVPTALADAHGFQVYASDNGGLSWRTADYHFASTADWEKLFVGPPPAGGARPTGYPDVVYVCANSPLEIVGPGRACYKSLDGGATFTSTGLEVPTLASPPVCPPLAANTGVVAGDGTIYIPQSCLGGTYVAISHNEAASFRWVRVPGAPSSYGLSAGAQLAIDRANNLYLLWPGGGGLALSVSRDGGQHWSTPLAVSPPALHDITLPALAADRTGHVGIVYYASTGSAAGPLSGYISQTTNALAAHPLFSLGALNDPAHPIFRNYGEADSPRADFIGAAYDAHGDLWGGLVKQLGPPNASDELATTGYVGRLVFAKQRRRHRTAPGRSR